MKAAVLHKAKDIRIEEIEKPVPKPGDALFRIESVGICGSDIHYYQFGRIGPKIINKTHILGHEISGIIESVGKNERGLKEGMAVGIEPAIPCGECEQCIEGIYNLCKNVKFCGSPPEQGGMKEYMTYPINNIFQLPDNMTVEEGIFIETLSIGIYSLDVSALKLGDSVLIIGAGNIGLTILQLARLSGAFNIYVVDLLDYRLKIAEEMGATAVINASYEDPVEKINRLTKGRGVDVGFEAAGAETTPQQTINSIKCGGTFVFVGIVPTSIISWDTEITRLKEVDIKMIRRARHSYERAISLIEKEKFNIKPFITHRFPLEKIKEAFSTVENYQDNVLKAVIKP